MFPFYRPTRRFALAFTFLLAAGMTTSASLLTNYLSNVLHGDPANWRYAAFAAFSLTVGAATLLVTEKYGKVDFYKAGGPPITQIKTLFWDVLVTRCGFDNKDDMSYADRVRWSHVDSIPFAGELTALWLEGKLASQPGYFGPVDTDEKYAGGMTATLAAVNRGGFLTRDSQAGLIETINGETWVQFAAVVGFADMDVLPVIQDVIDDTPGLEWSFCGDPDAYGWEDAFFPVTFRAHPDAVDLGDGYYGEPYTDFGRPVPDGDIADEYVGFGICRPELVRKLTAATQIVIADVDPGRNDRLWAALDEIAARLPRNWAFRTLLHRVPSSTE